MRLSLRICVWHKLIFRRSCQGNCKEIEAFTNNKRKPLILTYAICLHMNIIMGMGGGFASAAYNILNNSETLLMLFLVKEYYKLLVNVFAHKVMVNQIFIYMYVYGPR